MGIAETLDDYGKAAWITVMVLAFIVFWPLGLAIMAYMMWSGRMGCGRRGGFGRWYNGGSSAGRSRRDAWRQRAEASGNVAFDEYREDTLRRLEDEQKEFMDFLDQLRHAKDKAEFDQFMADRDKRAKEGDAPDGPEDAGPQPQT